LHSLLAQDSPVAVLSRVLADRASNASASHAVVMPR
jgi:hypothetical protein